MHKQDTAEFNNTINHIINSFTKDLKYSPATIKDYMRVYNSLRIYLEANQKSKLDATAIDEFTNKELSDSKISRYWFYAVRTSCKVLKHYISTGKVVVARQLMKRKDYSPVSFLKNEMNQFFIVYQEKYLWSESTLDKIKVAIKEFDEFIIKEGIDTLNEKIAIDYIKAINGTQHKLESHARILRQLFTYLKEINYTTTDLAKSVPIIKFIQHAKLPSAYTADEVEQLLKVSKVALGQRAGKRNYAMVLIAVRLGLRASDIRNLRFTNIDWEKDTITITMIKGQKELKLPLFGDIGNAIIDYEENERPKSDSNHVFLEAVPPFQNIKSSSSISKVVTRAFKAADIDISKRKKGSHSLRHSLASEMLNQLSNLHAISDTLGHSSIESAKDYLRIDSQKLRFCALDVKPVSKDFYQQQYGRFFSKN